MKMEINGGINVVGESFFLFTSECQSACMLFLSCQGDRDARSFFFSTVNR